MKNKMKNKMDKKELLNLIKTGEGLNLEFKETLSKEIKKEICAFANSFGGKILVGVKDTGKVKGIKISNQLLSQLQNFISELRPKLDVSYEIVDKIIVVDVPRGVAKEIPYSVNGKFYLREGANSQTLSREEIKEYFLFGRNNNFDELMNKDFDERKDFDEKSYELFRRYGKFSDLLKRDVLFENLKIRRKEYFTNAGVLLFAKDSTKFFTTSRVTCVLFQGFDKVKILDKTEFTGSVIKNYEGAINYLKEKLNTEFVINDAGPRKEFLELPEDALREAVINAITHKDYTSNGHVQIDVYKDRVEIVNPAVLPDLPFEDILRGSFPRNPVLHSLLNKIDFVENVGSGILRINDFMEEYRLGNPKYEFNGLWFITTFYRPDLEKNSYEKRVLNEPLNESLNNRERVGESQKKIDMVQVDAKLTQVDAKLTQKLSDKEKEIILFVINNKKITSKNLQNLFEISREMANRYFNKLMGDKLIIRKGTGKSTYYILRQSFGNHSAKEVKNEK